MNCEQKRRDNARAGQTEFLKQPRHRGHRQHTEDQSRNTKRPFDHREAMRSYERVPCILARARSDAEQGMAVRSPAVAVNGLHPIEPLEFHFAGFLVGA